MLERTDWPVLLIDDELDARTAEGDVLRAIVAHLTEELDCSVLVALTLSDGLELFGSHANVGCVVLDWEVGMEKAKDDLAPSEFLADVKSRNPDVPVFLITEKLQVEDLPLQVLEHIDGYIWKTEDTPDFIAGRIETALSEYIAGVMPPFFGELVKYAEEYKYAWHTPGHMGGVAFLKAPAGRACHAFFGENVFRADLSISVPELGSLLDHEGPVGDAEKEAAWTFRANQTDVVLNGTNTANPIDCPTRISRGDVALMDRNCHKSLNYAMVITGATPIYLKPTRNPYGTIGPIHTREFDAATVRKKIEDCPLIDPKKRPDKVKMTVVTNSTYDGLCYNVAKIKDKMAGVAESLHFDEAWYAYARFHPLYAGHFGMAEVGHNPEHPPVFTTHSTHKLLAAWSQASMIHIKDGGSERIDPDRFNEAYMMHGSTSPQYGMIATLDVAARMMKGPAGARLMHETLEEPVIFRKKMVDLGKELAEADEDDWWFTAWQPDKVHAGRKSVPFEEMDVQDLLSEQKYWTLNPKDSWHLFKDIDPDSVMLDPLKVTIATPGIGHDGTLAEQGIPAAIVTDFLMSRGIVVEKTGHYSWLLLFSIGITKGKSGTLLAELLHFKRLFDANAPLPDVLPTLAAGHPGRYKDMGVADLAGEMHQYIRKYMLVDTMLKCYDELPEQAMTPADAYAELVKGNVEYVHVKDLMGRVPAVMVVPYPPGIPVIMPGERFTKKTKALVDYLAQVEDFEYRFPGFEGDIHGVVREPHGDKNLFKIYCLKENR